MNKVQQYKSKHTPKGKVSILDKYMSEILELREDKFSYEQVKEFLLETYSITISSRNIQLQVKKYQDKPDTKKADKSEAKDNKVQPKKVDKDVSDLQKYFNKEL